MKKVLCKFRTVLALICMFALVIGLVPASAATRRTSTTTAVTVATKAELVKELGKTAASTITYSSKKKVSFTIPATANSSNKTLIIDAPKASITNKSKFSTITLNSCLKYTEKGKSNSITVNNSAANVIIGAAMKVAAVNIGSDSVSINLQKNASVAEMNVKTADASVTVNMGKKAKITANITQKASVLFTGNDSGNVDIVNSAKGTTVTAEIPVSAETSKKLNIILEPGSEGSSVDATTELVSVVVTNNSEEEPVMLIAGEVVSGADSEDDPDIEYEEPTPTPTKKVTPVPTAKVTPTEEPTPTPTKKVTPAPTAKVTPSEPTPTPTRKVTPAPTAKVTPTEEPTPTPTRKVTPAPTAKVTPTEEPTPTPTRKVTPAPTAKVTPTEKPTPTAKVTPTAAPSERKPEHIDEIRDVIKNDLGISKKDNRAEKIRRVNDWIAYNFLYDYDSYMELYDSSRKAGKPMDPTDIMFEVNGGICSGFSSLFRDFMDELDIPCIIVTSDAMNHAWNMVQLEDGEWYHVDVTWDNPDNKSVPPEKDDSYRNYDENQNKISYKYLLLTDEEILNAEHYGWNDDGENPKAEGTEYKGYFDHEFCVDVTSNGVLYYNVDDDGMITGINLENGKLYTNDISSDAFYTARGTILERVSRFEDYTCTVTYENGKIVKKFYEYPEYTCTRTYVNEVLVEDYYEYTDGHMSSVKYVDGKKSESIYECSEYICTSTYVNEILVEAYYEYTDGHTSRAKYEDGKLVKWVYEYSKYTCTRTYENGVLIEDFFEYTDGHTVSSKYVDGKVVKEFYKYPKYTCTSTYEDEVLVEDYYVYSDYTLTITYVNGVTSEAVYDYPDYTKFYTYENGSMVLVKTINK